jgi:hypothetical protein
MDGDRVMTGPDDAAMHLDDDALVLLYYGEADSNVREHAAACPECADRLAGLRRVLDAVVAEPVPEPDADYGRRLWERLGPKLQWPSSRHPRRWAGRVLVPLGMAASLVLAFLLGRHLPPAGAPALPSPQPPQPVAGEVRERILLVAVGEHLERSRLVLVELVHQGKGGEAAPGADAHHPRPVDMRQERARAEELLEANRIYRQSALQAGEPALGGVLDELERVLIEVANAPDAVSEAELGQLRQRIEARGILFKIRVIGSRTLQRGMAPGGRSTAS